MVVSFFEFCGYISYGTLFFSCELKNSLWNFYHILAFCVLQLQECIGSAITAMGPEKLLMLLPISLNEENLDCSNVWLLPILKKYVVGSSLGFFMEHVVPLAESFERACREGTSSTNKALSVNYMKLTFIYHSNII